MGDVMSCELVERDRSMCDVMSCELVEEDMHF
jgi:hypothetical protein